MGMIFNGQEVIGGEVMIFRKVQVLNPVINGMVIPSSSPGETIIIADFPTSVLALHDFKGFAQIGNDSPRFNPVKSHYKSLW